jgi:hypothetical protein
MFYVSHIEAVVVANYKYLDQVTADWVNSSGDKESMTLPRSGNGEPLVVGDQIVIIIGRKQKPTVNQIAQLMQRADQD